MNQSAIITFDSSSAHIPRFSPRVRGLRSNSGPLTDDQIRRVAPSIFAEGKHASRSDRYTYIPTSEVLAGLRREGFHPFMVQQGGSRDEEKKGFTKHLIRFRHANALPLGAEVGHTFHEIVMVNSHDGTSSYQLMAGCFRLVCTNGMVVGEGNGFGTVRIKHSGAVEAEVIEGANAILKRLPELNDQVREWNGLRLAEGERLAFARAALALRYDAEAPAPFTADKLLTVKRREDAQPTAWNTLNTIQENVIAGGIGYTLRDATTGRAKQRRRTREIAGIDQNVHLNRALWTLAQEMAKLKAKG